MCELMFNLKKYIITVLTVLVIAGCATPKAPKEFNQLSKTDYHLAAVDQYFIGVDDVVQVNVWRNPELSAEVPVRPDGKISVPLIGDILAGGKTPEQVAEAIRQELNVYIREAHVAVIITALNSHEYISRVRITGAVNAPISIPYRQGMTVLDAVLSAGGLSEYAAGNKSVLHRQNSQDKNNYNVYLFDILQKGSLETNYTLLPGDVISVPERLF